MKKCLIIFLISCLPVIFSGCAGTQISTTVSPEIEQLDDIVRSGIYDGIYPGAVLVVAKGDAILWAKTYGHHTYDESSPDMEFDTIFDLASVTKVVGTTNAAMVNLEQDRFELSDPVAEYIPGFEANGKGDVTLKDLMTHVSGLKPYENWKKVEEKRKPGQSHADALIEHYAQLELDYEPRTTSRYSCLNMQTMARVNENASGMRQEDILVLNVYFPLGMNDTRYLLNEKQKERAAPTIRKQNGTLVKGIVHDPLAKYHGSVEHCPGNAGLFSTAPDLFRFCRMVLNEGEYNGTRIFAPETIRAFTRRQTPETIDIVRGVGFQIYTEEPWMTELNRKPETRIVGHYGFTGPFIWMDKFTDTCIVFLTNRTFPYKKGETDQAPSDSHIRKQICDVVLRSLPEYKNYFMKR